MSIPGNLSTLVGQWAGTNRLWMMPTDPAHESDTTMSVATAAQGKFLTMQYTWAFDGESQEGLLILGQESAPDNVKASWVDSWHNGDRIMPCQGGLEEQGLVSVKGSYPAPPGPDWGWQITIQPSPDGTFMFAMYNITPDGQAHLAVEAVYRRGA